MNLVLFDFDSTLTSLDTTLPFGVFVANKCSARHRLVLLVVALMFARFGLVSNTRLKLIFARLFLRDQARDRLNQWTQEFHEAFLPDLIDDEVLRKLRTHADKGARVYLVSDNFDFFLQPLVKRWSLAGIIATGTDCHFEISTGRIVGAACHGHEKVQRALICFGTADLSTAVAYGNEDDAPLLRAVQTGYLVRRAKPAFPLGRLRRFLEIISGKISHTNFTNAPEISRFYGSK